MKKSLVDKMGKKIEEIPLSKIVPSRWGNGVRDKDKYEEIKENIKAVGLNENPRVFPLGDGNFEVYIGDHRVMILKDLNDKDHWTDKAPVFVDNITPEEAWEKCISDNICRADYGSVELENKITQLFKTKNYRSHAELGKRIGLTGQRVGQLIKAKTVRDELKEKSKVTFDLSTENILAVRHLTSINDQARLLNLVKNKKLYGKDIEKVAKLCQQDKDLNQRILSDGISYYDIIAVHQSNINKKPKNKKTITITDSRLVEDTYNTLSENLKPYMLGLNDTKKAQGYLKMTIVVIAEALYLNDAMTKEDCEKIKKDILKIDRTKLKGYSGERLDLDVAQWCD